MNPANSNRQTDDRAPITRISVRYIHDPPLHLAIKHSTPNRFAGRSRAGQAFRFAADDQPGDDPGSARCVSKADSALTKP